jgi:riboflavin transporter FmnP
MRKFLGVLGALIALTAVKAIVWVARYGTPPSLLPTTVGDMVGLGFVAVLLITFVSCLIWYLLKGREQERRGADSE